jgi:hypothetical protein
MNKYSTQIERIELSVTSLSLLFLKETDQQKKDVLAGAILLINDSVNTIKRLSQTSFVLSCEEEAALERDSAAGVEGL